LAIALEGWISLGKVWWRFPVLLQGDFQRKDRSIPCLGHGKDCGVVLALWFGFGSWYLIVYGLAVEGWIAVERLVPFGLLAWKFPKLPWITAV
jgi:hypothetical protein